MSVQLELPCGEGWADPEPLDDGSDLPPPLLGYGRPATGKPRRVRLWQRITTITPIDHYPWETQP